MPLAGPCDGVSNTSGARAMLSCSASTTLLIPKVASIASLLSPRKSVGWMGLVLVDRFISRFRFALPRAKRYRFLPAFLTVFLVAFWFAFLAAGGGPFALSMSR